MRHRSPRPLLDRLLPDAAPGMARRGVLLIAAVVAAVTLGVAVAGPLVDPAPGDRTIAVKSPFSSASASWSIGTPPTSREPRPSRGGERSAAPASSAPAAPVEREPSPTSATRQPSPSGDEQPSRSPSETASSSPSQSSQEDPTPADTSAPDTSATTSEVEDDVWTVTSTADETGSFECSLDGGEYVECDPTTTFDDLENGKHTLVVRAVDEAGNVDPSPTELVTHITGDLAD